MTGVPSLHEIRLESRLCLRVGKGRYFGRGGVDELLEGLFQRVGVLTIRGEGVWGGVGALGVLGGSSVLLRGGVMKGQGLGASTRWL